MSLVFLSHCSANNTQALALAQWLEGNGWADYFLDISPRRGLAPGEQWQQALKDASRRCEAVVFLISGAWLDSKWCLAEFLLAKQLGKKIFGVLIEDIPIDELPDELTSQWQLCDLVKGDARVTFDVAREPLVPANRVELPEVGLSALKRGLQNAGLEAAAFPWPPENEPERAPYRGLKPYEAQDAAIFFGRDATIVRGLDQVRQLRDNSSDNLLVILGSSGAGKSSFMRAGLWPRLKRDDHHFYPLPVVRPRGAAMNGEEGLVNSLVTALTDVGISSISRGEMRSRFKAGGSSDALMGYLKQLRDAMVARAVTDTPEPTFVLPIDQGEELYAPDGAEEAEQLRRQLLCLKKHDGNQFEEQKSPGLLAIVTIRTDLYEHLQTDELLQDVGRQIIDLTPMDRAEYKRIIEGPAQRATEAGNALVIEPALTEELLNDTHGADALPMLAFTLERLYTDYGADGNLALEEYQLLGGVTGSLTAAIDAAMASPQNAPVIPADKVAQQRLLKEAFIPWLAEVDEQSGERRRRIADWDEFPAETHPMVERLTRARLLVRDLRSDTDTDDKREVVEVAHEALLRRWPALVDWLDADEDSLKAIGAVSRAAQHWAQSNQNDEFLEHRGERLLDAEKLLNRDDFKKRLQATGCDYLARCRAHEDEQKEKERQQIEKERKQTRRLRLGFVVVVLLAAGASFAAWRAYESSQEATIAAIQRQISQAETEFEISPTRGLLLAVEALYASRPDPVTCEEQVLCVRVAKALVDMLSSTGGTPLLGHEQSVLALSFSGDGNFLASIDSSNVRLWRTNQNALFLSEDYPGGDTTVSLDHEGKWLATGAQGAVSLFGIDQSSSSPRLIGNQTFHTGENMFGQTSVSFSVDGKFLLMASGAASAYLNRLDQLEISIAKWGGDFQVRFASFTSDGKFILFLDWDGKIRRWPLDEFYEWPLDELYDQRTVLLHDIKGTVGGERFSPDGNALVIPEGLNRAGRLVKLDGRHSDGKPAGNGDDISLVKTVPEDGWVEQAAAFSADGKLVAIPGQDGTVRVWKVGHNHSLDKANKPIWLPVMELRGHEGPVNAASFSPLDGNLIATAGDDGTVRLWHYDQPTAITSDRQSLESWMTRLEDLIALARATAGRNLTKEEWDRFFPDEPYPHTFPGLQAPEKH